MNILLWVLQILLALHTIAGAVWKFSNPEQAAFLKTIPHGVWLAMGVVELLCALSLILPAFIKRTGILIPIAATCITVEMLAFCLLNIFSGDINISHLIYWTVVALLSAFIANGRFVIKPV